MLLTPLGAGPVRTGTAVLAPGWILCSNRELATEWPSDIERIPLRVPDVARMDPDKTRLAHAPPSPAEERRASAVLQTRGASAGELVRRHPYLRLTVDFKGQPTPGSLLPARPLNRRLRNKQLAPSLKCPGSSWHYPNEAGFLDSD